MKWWFPVVLAVLISCNHKSSADLKPKVAAMHVDQSSYNATADSLVIEEQNRHGEWMVITFYSLKNIGYNYKRAWNYIDSATRSIYKGSIPEWYAFLKQQTDSSIRDKKLYRRVPIM